MRATVKASILIPFIALAWGCGGAEKVWVRVSVPSEVDLTKYRLAVLPLLPLKEDDGEAGHSIAYFLHRELRKVKGMELLSPTQVKRTLEGERLTKEMLESPSDMIDICGELGVDAVVAGTYRLYHVAEPRRYYIDRYSPVLRRYVTEAVTYYVKTYYLKLHLVVIDGRRGEPVVEGDFESSYSEPHNLGTLVISEVADRPPIQKLALGAISQFMAKIAPHYEREERFLLR